MALVVINKNPKPRELRLFACVYTPIFCAILIFVFYKAGQETALKAAAGIGGAMLLLGLIAPIAVKPIFILGQYVAFPFGFVISHILLGAFYYLVFTPIGLLMRLFGRDPMTRNLDRSKNTYWIPRKPNVNSKSYFKQY